MEESGYSLLSNDCPRCIDRSPVIISRTKERVVVTALQLESSLEDFRGYVDKRSGEVGNEACIGQFFFEGIEGQDSRTASEIGQ